MRTVTIYETASGWEYGGTEYPSAECAANVKRCGGVDVTELVWKPVTRVGRLVAKSLAASNVRRNT